MTARVTDPIGAFDTFSTSAGPQGIYRLSKLEAAGWADQSLAVLDPRAARIDAPQLRRLRSHDRRCQELCAWNAAKPAEIEIPFKPARVVFQDFTASHACRSSRDA